MPLPMTRGEFNRLGDRLIAHGRPAEADLQLLATALDAYQAVLEQVKGHLHGLGFAPTGRVKTTPTLTDKLRRQHGMELSRVQDLAGARITVRNLAEQDDAKDKISNFYNAQGCRLRVTDRRVDPRFGYRAVHLVAYVDELPTEIQIRTELQDSWAQIFERLADRWGRGIRYGQDPEDPQGIVRSGEMVMTRSELVATLMRLSDDIWSVEHHRREIDELNEVAGMLDSKLAPLRSDVPPEALASTIPPDLAPQVEGMVAARAGALKAGLELGTSLDAEFQALAAIPAAEVTWGQLRRTVLLAADFVAVRSRKLSTDSVAHEQQVRDTLRLVAGATDEGA
jgi:ppGpp synthetase/RelA/SpoT-type nucleotidyltranferase